MAKQEFHNAEWRDCPSGVLQSVVIQNRRHRRRKVVQVAVTALSLILLVGAIPTLSKIHFTSDRAVSKDLRCDAIATMLQRFSQNQLTAAEADSVDLHLRSCPGCQLKLESMMSSNAQFCPASVAAPEAALAMTGSR